MTSPDAESRRIRRLVQDELDARRVYETLRDASYPEFWAKSPGEVRAARLAWEEKRAAADRAGAGRRQPRGPRR